ncbi:MAG: hypothetical protein F6K50_42150 [Moorea sp. SIO3I7]|nr:hypothetical protein [Moorena sp. SIO3I7]
MKVEGYLVEGYLVEGYLVEGYLVVRLWQDTGKMPVPPTCRFHQHAYSTNMPYSLLPTPYSLLPIPDSRLPTPDSRFPTPQP